jgi:hypothetical protein
MPRAQRQATMCGSSSTAHFWISVGASTSFLKAWPPKTFQQQPPCADGQGHLRGYFPTFHAPPRLLTMLSHSASREGSFRIDHSQLSRTGAQQRCSRLPQTTISCRHRRKRVFGTLPRTVRNLTGNPTRSNDKNGQRNGIFLSHSQVLGKALFRVD